MRRGGHGDFEHIAPSQAGPCGNFDAVRPPADIAALVQHGLALHRAGRFDEAETVYQQVLKISPDRFDVLILSAFGHFQRADYAATVRQIDRALKLKPDSAEALYNRGLALHKLGRFDAAVASYDRAVALKRDYAEAFYNRGHALNALGRPEQALASYDRAAALNPGSAEIFNNRGNTLARLNRLGEAVASYDRAIKLRPDYVEALDNHGGVLRALKQYDAALASYDRAIALRADHAQAFRHRGDVLHALKRFDEAVASYDRAVALDPADAEAFNNRGNALQDLGRFEDALASYGAALALRPDYAQAVTNRGNALQRLRRFEAALACYDLARTLKPDHAETFYNRGVALQELKRFDEAVASYESAIALKPDYAEAFSNRGYALQELKRLDEGLASCDRAIAFRPGLAEAYNNRGNIWQAMGRHENAAADFERTLHIDPDFAYAPGQRLHSKMYCCDWRSLGQDIARVTGAVRARKRTISPLCLMGLSGNAADQRLCSEIWSQDKCAPSPVSVWQGERYRHGRIRLAYLSADFREHPVSYLMAGLFEQHDRTCFEVFAVSFGPDDASAMRSRLEGAFDRFIDVQGMNDLAVANLLHGLEIDIAVDLMGFTQYARPGILASRPARVQVNYLGFPGTMGAGHIDYIIADRFVIPLDRQACYSENVVYLPDTFQAAGSTRRLGEHKPTRAAIGLPDRGVVFCSFNNRYKITPAMFDVWMRLLHGVEGSVLWLLGGDAAAERNLRRETEDRGIAADRLMFAPRVGYADYLTRYQVADLFLDTLPFNAGTTASDALWAGLPLVTCAGDAFAARMAGSLLNAVGLPELVTHNLQDYETVALALGRDKDRLAQVRARLSANRAACPLFDAGRFRRHIEAAYQSMWHTHLRGEPARSFSVDPVAT